MVAISEIKNMFWGKFSRRCILALLFLFSVSLLVYNTVFFESRYIAYQALAFGSLLSLSRYTRPCPCLRVILIHCIHTPDTQIHAS